MASRQDPTAADIAYAQYSAAEKTRTVGGRVYHRIICKTPLPAPVGGVELILPRAMFRGARAGCVEDSRRPRVPACRPGDAALSGRGAAVVCAVACVRGTRLHGRRHRRVFARVVSATSAHRGRSVQGGGVGVDTVYFDAILARVQAVPDGSNTVIGTYMCQGKMPPSVRARYEAMRALPVPPENLDALIENFDRARTHPDADDRDRLRAAVLCA